MEYKRMATVNFSQWTGYYEISWMYKVAMVAGIYPAVVVHPNSAVRAHHIAFNCRHTVVTHDRSFPWLGRCLAGVFEWTHNVIVRVVPVLEPKRCFYRSGLGMIYHGFMGVIQSESR